MKKKHIWKLIFFLLIISVGYLGVQIYMATDNSVTTQVAIEQDFSDSISTFGVAVRDEVILHYSSNAVVSYLHNDGERISEGDIVANIYANAQDAENSARAERIYDELNLLSDLITTYSNNIPDIESISKQQTDDYYELLDVLYSGQYQNSTYARNELIYNLSKLQLATEIESDVTTKISELTSQATSLSNNSLPIDTVIAPQSGHFVGIIDGFETAYTPSIAETWDIIDLQRAVDATSQLGEPVDNTGKIILDYRWEFYSILPESEANRLTVGYDYELVFTAVGGAEVECTLERADEPDEEGNVLLCFSADTLNENIVTLRHSQADIIIRSYSGIRISRDALRIVDGQKGVYVKYGNLLQFKAINPIFETDNYLLLPMTQSADNQVKLYDEIVVEGRNLYDGKNL